MSDFGNFLNSIHNLKIGIVYSFESNTHPNLQWYDKWHTDVISSYGSAIEYMSAIPFFIDVNTFCQQVFSKQLPRLDCIFNLNAGITPISNWGLVPSVALWNKIPVLPCDSDTIIIGERKDISSLVAEKEGWLIPNRYTKDDLKTLPVGIKILEKPKTLGGSVGIKLIDIPYYEYNENNMYEEFILGYDITVPIVYDPVNKKLSCVEAIVYIPHTKEKTSWFHGEESKRNFIGYDKKIIPLPAMLQEKLIDLADKFNITTLCRFDLRLKSKEMIDDFTPNENNQIYFLEINPMPTLRRNINFIQCIAGMDKNNPLTKAKQIFSEHFSSDDDIKYLAFILSLCLYRGL